MNIYTNISEPSVFLPALRELHPDKDFSPKSVIFNSTNPVDLNNNEYLTRFLNLKCAVLIVKSSNDSGDDLSKIFIDVEDSIVVLSLTNPFVVLQLLALSGFGHLCPTYVWDGTKLTPFKSDLKRITNTKLLTYAILKFSNNILKRTTTDPDSSYREYYASCINSELDNV